MDSLWDFSIRHYAKPGVADACLTLQDQYGLDVNLVLFCLWFGWEHGELRRQQLDLVVSFSITWAANVVKPLRLSRRWIKQHRKESAIPIDELEKLRSNIKRLELEAEHLQQNRLQQLVSESVGHSKCGSHEAAVRNVYAYLLRMGIENNKNIETLLATVSQLQSGTG